MNYISLFVIMQLFLIKNTASLESIHKLISASSALLTHGTKYKQEQVFDTTRFLQQYDFIIVGGGTAGCIVANRLTENPYHTVLLLEAGGDENFLLTIPGLAPYMYLTNVNWGYSGAKDNACLGFRNKRCLFPRGKVLGGTSAFNGMFFTRGNRKDYDRWLEMGNYGWGYEDVLPYFKKLEDVQIPEYLLNEYRGTGGPVPVTFPNYETPLRSSFEQAMQEFGYYDIDYNGEYDTGYGKLQCSAQNGSRFSSNRAYLMPIKYRKNLHVAKNAFVTKLIINPITKTTEGVEFIKNNKKYQIHVKKEVILSAGTFSTPQILMLSGIGPQRHLNKLKIPVIKNLKVGYNLQDHVAYIGLLFLIDQPIGINFRRLINNLPNELNDYFIDKKGPLTSVLGTESISLLNTVYNNDTSYPDIEFIFFSTGISQDPLAYLISGMRKEIYDSAFRNVEQFSAFTIIPMLLRPQSIGRLTLKSRNPYQHPDILANYYKEEYDINVMIQAIRLAIKTTESKAFNKFGTRSHKVKLPECDYEFDTDLYWRCMLRQLTHVCHHFVGTAKMGPHSDPNAVVDPELRVNGIKGLRVIDASVMPFVPSAHTGAPVMMIAEKGADLIKHWWSYK